MGQQFTVNLNDVWVQGGPIDRTEGITETFSIKVLGATSFSSLSCKAFRKSATVTSTVFPSGSITSSGNIITLKPATGFVGTANYTIEVIGTDNNSDIRSYKLMVRIQKEKTGL